MKKSIFLYLFIFSLLINIFAYMYFTNEQKYTHERIEKVQSHLATVRDSIKKAGEKNVSDNYFSLQNDTNAREYFGEQDPDAIAIKVRDAIYAKNTDPNGNPLAGYPAMDGRPFTIGKIKVLNHRWVVADFTNGLRWGEVLLRYFVEDDGSITVERVENTLFSFTPY
jgi:hypothetical protein